jgi:hypothetical protein
MNVVLYTIDLEPITILDLPVWLLEQLEKEGAIRIAVLKPPGWTGEVNSQTPIDKIGGVDTVTVYCERLRWRDNTLKFILITPDEELALSLKPEWLPGQRASIQGYQQAIQHLTQQLIKAMRKN